MIGTRATAGIVIGVAILVAQASVCLGAQAGAPTYAADVEPILRRQCVGCHRAGDIAPFSLEDFEDVRRRGRAIADATARRYMPPWKPVAGYGGPFLGTRG